jgi:hypothetical protein
MLCWSDRHAPPSNPSHPFLFFAHNTAIAATAAAAAHVKTLENAATRALVLLTVKQQQPHKHKQRLH